MVIPAKKEIFPDEGQKISFLIVFLELFQRQNRKKFFLIIDFMIFLSSIKFPIFTSCTKINELHEISIDDEIIVKLFMDFFSISLFILVLFKMEKNRCSIENIYTKNYKYLRVTFTELKPFLGSIKFKASKSSNIPFKYRELCQENHLIVFIILIDFILMTVRKISNGPIN